MCSLAGVSPIILLYIAYSAMPFDELVNGIKTSGMKGIVADQMFLEVVAAIPRPQALVTFVTNVLGSLQYALWMCQEPSAHWDGLQRAYAWTDHQMS